MSSHKARTASGPGPSAHQDTEPTPLVIVEGFLGGAGPLLWGPFEHHCNNDVTEDDEFPRRKVIFAR